MRHLLKSLLITVALSTPPALNAAAGSTKAPAPTPRTFLIAEAVGGFIYAGQGNSNLPSSPYQGWFDRYDPTTDTWAPLPMTSEIYQRASVVLAGKVYAFGGVEHGSPLDTVEAFDPSTNSWSARASMPTTRTGPAAVVNGLAYVLGGSFTSGDNVGTTANEAYDANTDSWVSRAPMLRPRMFHSAVALAGKIYLFGGESGGTIFDVIDVYDPGTDSWTTLPTRMPRPRAGAAAVLLNDRILLIGGGNNTEGCLAAVEEYDPALDRWATREPMPTPRLLLAATVSNGIVYAIGGEHGPAFAVVEAYDPTQDETRPAPQTQFFLHGSVGTANPPTLFLNPDSPTSATAKYVDSSGVKFSGGNLWKEVGAWPAASTLTNGTLRGLAGLHAWLGLKNSDDQGTRFDLRAEVYSNNTLVAAGETYCIQDLTRNPDLAKEATVLFGSPGPATFNGATDVLSLKLLTRIGTDGSGNFCGGHSNAVGVRLYFDATTRPARFSATY